MNDNTEKLNKAAEDAHLDIRFEHDKKGDRAPITPEQYIALKSSGHSMSEITGSTAFTLVEEKPSFIAQMAIGNTTRLAANAAGHGDFNASNEANLAITMNSKHYIKAADNISDADLKALKAHAAPVQDGLTPDVAAMNRDLANFNDAKGSSMTVAAGGGPKSVGNPSVKVDLTKIIGDVSYAQLDYLMKGMDGRGEFLPNYDNKTNPQTGNNEMTYTFPKDQAQNIAKVLAAKNTKGDPVITNNQLFGAEGGVFKFNEKTGVLTVDKNTTQEQAQFFNAHLEAIKQATLGKSPEMVLALAQMGDENAGKTTNKTPQAGDDSPVALSTPAIAKQSTQVAKDRHQ